MKYPTFLLCFLALSSLATVKPTTCLSSREFVTTVNYLRERKDLGLQKKSIVDIADKVSKGCSGASQRFINIVKVLSKVGIDSASAVKSALKFAEKEDQVTEAFINTFKKAYSPDFLDLDALNAMRISLELSANFQGDPKKAKEDFEKLAHFCKNKKSLDLPLPRCSQLALDITKKGEKFDSNIAEPFIKLVNFLLKDGKGPKQSIGDALKTAEELISYGPTSNKNFQEAYIFAIDKKGLAYTELDAIKFAKVMAKRSLKSESPQ